ncbi:MAG: redox-regulated ATPase YchF [Nitrososphaeraceae archaeon]|nr:redox-regulated ATPase YchF [Nitrososphaeraceae archaeon]
MLIGLIGKANVGKSTFFNASTNLSVHTANYPFTTINPNLGVTHVRVNCVCREFEVQDNPNNSMCIDGIRFIPVKIIDVAGLVPGAHLGKGLGNKFLDDSRQADGLIHVVDISGSTDFEGRFIDPGNGDPLEDIKFVEEEFDLWFFSIINKDWNKTVKDLETRNLKIEDVLYKKMSGLAVPEQLIIETLMELGLKGKRPDEWTHDEILNFAKKIRKKSKPLIIAANKSDLHSSEENIKKIREKGYQIVPCASEAEVVLRRASTKGLLFYLPGDSDFKIKNEESLNLQQRHALELIKQYLKKYGTTGIQEIINKICFDVLKTIVVYPVEDDIKLSDKKGNVLPHALLVNKGTTAKVLATMIHADLGNGFLYAIDVRTNQRLGAEHVLNNNDVIKIVSTTRRG